MASELTVVLTQQEIEQADQYLRKITEENSKNHLIFRIDSATNMGNVEQYKLDGFRAEKAVAKGLKLRWNNNVYNCKELQNKINRAADVASLEVKSTKLPHGCLIIKPTDLISATYVLVVVENKWQYVLKGWCDGKAGKIEPYYKPGTHGQPAFYVPQSSLKDINILIAKLDNFL